MRLSAVRVFRLLLASALLATGAAAQDETREVSGLAAPVEVLTDRWGLDHIYAENEDDLFFDLDGIRAVMAKHTNASAPELARHICHAAERFERGNPDPGDDKTVVVIRSLDG